MSITNTSKTGEGDAASIRKRVTVAPATKRRKTPILILRFAFFVKLKKIIGRSKIDTKICISLIISGFFAHQPPIKKSEIEKVEMRRRGRKS